MKKTFSTKLLDFGMLLLLKVASLPLPLKFESRKMHFVEIEKDGKLWLSMKALIMLAIIIWFFIRNMIQKAPKITTLWNVFSTRLNDKLCK